jgi:uncharacterized protein (DUF4415 family)/uncharacterized DUF497 family protein
MYMETRFTWDPVIAQRNQRDHGISFAMAREMFADPNHVGTENYRFEDEGEQRYLAVGMTRNLVLVVCVSLIVAGRESRSFTSFQQQRQWLMSKVSTSSKSIKISDRTRELYEKRDRRLDRSEVPQLSPEQWGKGIVGKYYRPLKTQISFRIDNDVLGWLKSKGEGHLSRINAILRERMESELR